MPYATSVQIENSSYVPNIDGITRISKSSFMNFLGCPRQFWWNYVSDVPRPPPSEAMIRGGQVHEVMEHGLLRGPDVIQEVATDVGLDLLDPALESMPALLHQIANDLGSFEIVEVEKKHQFHDKMTVALESQENVAEIIWVGMIDGIIRHPDGGLILVELKTGNMGVGKLSRTRKELCFYKMILEKIGTYDDITHFMYICPDYLIETEKEDKLLLEADKKGKTMWLGTHNGIALMEPVSSRSINAFHKGLNVALSNLFSHQYPMKWNDFFCMQWCDYNMACQEERFQEEGGFVGE